MPKGRRARGTGGFNESFVHGKFRYTIGYLPAGYPIPGTDQVLEARLEKRSKLRMKKGGEEEAKRLLAQALEELAASVLAVEAGPGATYTLAQAIEDWHAWAPTQARTSQGTADKLYDQLQNWAVPRLGHMLLAEVDLETLTEFFDDIAPETGAPTLRDLRSTISRVMDRAMVKKTNTGFAGPNTAAPLKGKLPEAGRKPKKKDFLREDQLNDLFEVTKGTREHALVMMGAMTGLRPGELRALKWTHLLLDRPTPVVYVQKWARKDGDGPTKTGESRRYVPLMPDLLEALKAHWQTYGEYGYVFVREDGKQFDKDGIAWRVGKALRSAGITGIDDVYCLRHSFCSLMYRKGTPGREIMKLMGHDNEVTFKKVYAHLDPEEDIAEAASVMARVWGKAA